MYSPITSQLMSMSYTSTVHNAETFNVSKFSIHIPLNIQPDLYSGWQRPAPRNADPASYCQLDCQSINSSGITFQLFLNGYFLQSILDSFPRIVN